MESFKNDGTSSTISGQWSVPQQMDVIEKPDCLEIIYKETSNLWVGTHLVPEQRVFKIVYSCKEGEWHKSDRIYGKIHLAQRERYSFE